MKIETDYGTLSWSGPLNELTMVRLDGSEPQPLSRVIAMTNGGILEFLPPYAK